MKQMINIEIQAADPDTQAVLTLNRLLAMSLINAGFRQSDGPALETHVTDEILDVEVSLYIPGGVGQARIFASKTSTPPKPDRGTIAEAINRNTVDWPGKIDCLYTMGKAVVYGAYEADAFGSILRDLNIAYRVAKQEPAASFPIGYVFTLLPPKD